MRSFLSTISIVAARENTIRHTLTASVDDHDMKKKYCEHPAIRVTILFNAGGRPVFFANNLTAITKRIATKMSKAITALYSSPPYISKKGIMIKEKPGGNSC